MPWERADTIALIYLTAMILCLVFGGIIGWAMRGWHEEEIQAGVKDGVNKSAPIREESMERKMIGKKELIGLIVMWAFFISYPFVLKSAYESSVAIAVSKATEPVKKDCQ